MTIDITQLVASHKGLMQAHDHAERFHSAMARALYAQKEIESQTKEFGHAETFWVKSYQDSLVSAAASLQNMPVKWAAILTVDVEGK